MQEIVQQWVFLNLQLPSTQCYITGFLRLSLYADVLCYCPFSLTSPVCSLQGLCSYDQYRCGTPLPLMSPSLGMAVYLKMEFSRQMLHLRVVKQTFHKFHKYTNILYYLNLPALYFAWINDFVLEW